jgi:16S rRNA processing protein RimM
LSEESTDSEALIAIARVLKPRGLHGEAFLNPLTDFPERFDDLKTVTVEDTQGDRTTRRVERIRAYGSRYAVKFKGINNPDAAKRIRGSLLLVRADEVHPLPEGNYYVFELVGLKVVTEAGEQIGEVVDVLSLPGNDVYVVDRDGEELLLPAVKDLITVDLESEQVVVKDFEGLL